VGRGGLEPPTSAVLALSAVLTRVGGRAQGGVLCGLKWTAAQPGARSGSVASPRVDPPNLTVLDWVDSKEC
jgi:hypothetical protein